MTDSIDFSPGADSRPVFVDRPNGTPGLDNFALGDTVFVDNQAAASWSFGLRVWDADVNQDLEVHWRIVKAGDLTPLREPTIALPGTGSLTRDFDIVVQSGQLLTDNCHRIDVVVSSRFFQPDNPAYFDETFPPDDLARFTFWIWEGEPAGNDSQKLVDTCNAKRVRTPLVSEGVAGASGQ